MCQTTKNLNHSLYEMHIIAKFNQIISISLIYNSISYHMGICPSLSPEERVISEKNSSIKDLFMLQLSHLSHCQFPEQLKKAIKNISKRYLFNEGILEDIDNLMMIGERNESVKEELNSFDNFQAQVQNSCLILEDEGVKLAESEKMKQQATQSFIKNLSSNESLVLQINLIYQAEFDQHKYKKSLYLFLKWASLFQEHQYAGFLKPIYRQFCQHLYSIPPEELDNIIQQTREFVSMMVTIYTDIYELKLLNKSLNGELFKNENVFNLIMSLLFRRTKIRKFVQKIIYHLQSGKINRLKKKLQNFQQKSISYFGVPKRFCLQRQSQINDESIDIIENPPYYRCIKLAEDLCKNNQTPITKLKIIMGISKEIIQEIKHFYQSQKEEVPDMDPDSLMSIIIYIIVKANDSRIFEELKLVEHFTTTNTLHSISGFYLSSFNAAIETILTM